MTRLLLDLLKETYSDETQPKVLVELGASTMLPCLVAATRYPMMRCIATDLKKVMPLVEQSHLENDNLSNVVPLELAWGDRGHHERLKEQLGGQPVDYIICADLIYDEVSCGEAYGVMTVHVCRTFLTS